MRTAAVVLVLTTLVCVVAFVGDGPIRGRPETYVPTRAELIEVGVITSDFPVPGALPPEIFPPEAYGLGPPGPPAWLLWALGAIAAAAVLRVCVGIVREVMTWRIGLRRLRLGGWRRRREEEIPSETAPPVAEQAAVARRAVDAALEPLREPADPRAAVIEAYARMENVLAEQDRGRRPAEAPREYLRRVMREQGMPEQSLVSLTELFEEARYSPHPVAESAPRRAARELEAARASLSASTLTRRGPP